MSAVNWTVIRNSALVGLLIILPVALISSLLVNDAPTWSAWLFLIVTIIGFMAAGWTAGRSRSDTPILHGSIAAAVTYVIAQLVGVVARLMADEAVNLVAIALSAVLAAACGVGGALLADWFARRRVAAASA